MNCADLLSDLSERGDNLMVKRGDFAQNFLLAENGVGLVAKNFANVIHSGCSMVGVNYPMVADAGCIVTVRPATSYATSTRCQYPDQSADGGSAAARKPTERNCSPLLLRRWSEPHRDCRRPFGLSYAAMATSSV